MLEMNLLKGICVFPERWLAGHGSVFRLGTSFWPFPRIGSLSGPVLARVRRIILARSWLVHPVGPFAGPHHGPIGLQVDADQQQAGQCRETA